MTCLEISNKKRGFQPVASEQGEVQGYIVHPPKNMYIVLFVYRSMDTEVCEPQTRVD